MHLILASQSPRRRELLQMIVPEFTVTASDANEELPADISPEEGVQLLARRKAQAVVDTLPRNILGRPDWCVVGSDTLVVAEGEVLGKPRDPRHCHEMLGKLSGKWHTVHTGVAALTADRSQCFCQSTQVEFYPLTPEDIEWYASTPEPYDKAGAYGIQGLGSVLIKGIQGDFFTVMGLPVARLYRVLKELGL